ncbi:hypothetical protein Poly59_14620 [Rubripirellula reticaptiva]|uniref:Uncharacterized protein n=2 Tax=Rubripirellula reticaptiva TaxID=2528013 RepID=A0A5C6F525_9BACT|nr:hypothetical protein Poly59_14620 [Rubripirellula reticaptiva]
MVLREDRIIETVAMIQRRIEDRFPDAGLTKLCLRLYNVATKAAERSVSIAKPILWIRCTAGLLATALVASVLAIAFLAVRNVNVDPTLIADGIGQQPEGVVFWTQALESGLNVLIFFSIAIFFLFSLENRIKRRRALGALHELRSIAHIIDMHQLTKDPERCFRNNNDTKHSPKQTMTPLLLNRYLDYCSEMLSLTGKIAALYVQNFDDADAVAAVSEIEQLTNGMSRKIWQKIMVLEQLRDALQRTDSDPRLSASTNSQRGLATPVQPPAPSPQLADSQTFRAAMAKKTDETKP